MASTYVNNLRLNEMATGDGSGTWGTTTNTNLELIADAFGYGTEAITLNADAHTTTIADGAADEGRAFYVKYTGTLDSACTITIGPNTIKKVWIIENATSGSQNIIMKQGTGGTITIGNGNVAVIYGDGAGAGAAMTDAFADLELSAALTVAGNVDFNGDLDVDGTTNLDAVDIDGAVQIDSTVTVGVDDTGYDVKFFGDTASAYMLWDTSTDDLVLAGAAGIDLAGDLDVDGTTNLDAVDIDGAVQVDSTITVGADDTGYDVKFFGDTASAYMLWDTSADDLILGGASGLVVPDGNLTLASTAVTSTAAELNILDGVTSSTAELNILDGVTSTTAELNILDGATVVVGEINYLDLGATAVGTAIASKAVVLDSNKDYTGIRNLTATTLIGALTGDASGNAATATALETARTIGGTSFDGTANIAVALAADATTLATPRAINGVDFDGSAPITVTAAAGTLSGATLASGVTASSLTSLGTISALSAGSGTFSSNVSMTVADNSAGLQVICTDADASAGPLILLDRDTASPADGDTLGRIYNQGRNDADELITYAQITTKSNDVTDGTEDGEMLINVMTNGTATSVMSITGAEIQTDATLVDLNGNLDVSGTSTLTGAVACSDTLAVTGDVNIDSRTLYVDASTDRVAVNSPSDAEMLANFTVTDATDQAPATSGNASGHVIIGNTNNYGIALGATSTGQYTWLQAQALDSAGVFRRLCLNPAGGNVGVNMTAPTVALHVTGAITATGAITGSSKSFKIDHPLDSMKDTHDLFHVSVESPRADLQYRGVVTLSGGTASVDLDESARMSDGTWEALCRDPQVFLQNDTGWSALKGSISGSTLIISCENTNSTDTVSWMVVAERDDPTYLASTITDDDGLLIIEAEKPEDVEDGS